MATVTQTLKSLATLRKKRAELDKKIVQAEQALSAEFSKTAAAKPKMPAKKPVKKETKPGVKRGRKPAAPKA
jgi:hypothetical protein